MNFDFINLIGDDDNEDDGGLRTMAPSHYVDSDSLTTALKHNKNSFTVMTLNIQSLHCEKHFNELQSLVISLAAQNTSISAICLQECFFGEYK